MKLYTLQTYKSDLNKGRPFASLRAVFVDINRQGRINFFKYTDKTRSRKKFLVIFVTLHLGSSCDRPKYSLNTRTVIVS